MFVNTFISPIVVPLGSPIANAVPELAIINPVVSEQSPAAVCVVEDTADLLTCTEPFALPTIAIPTLVSVPSAVIVGDVFVAALESFKSLTADAVEIISNNPAPLTSATVPAKIGLLTVAESNVLFFNVAASLANTNVSESERAGKLTFLSADIAAGLKTY